MSNIQTNSSIKRLEEAILQAPQIDLCTQHCLSGGMYARTITIKAGTVLTGATHKTDHINIVSGDISVTTDEGVKRLTGYHVLSTKAGSKRAGYAHADTMWTTVCKTDLACIEDIEDELVEESSNLQTRINAIEHTEVKEIGE
jgi:hypothetical protein